MPQIETLFSSEANSYALQITGKKLFTKSIYTRRKVPKEEEEENIKRNIEAFNRRKKENLKKYGEVYSQFFDRDGPELYESLTGDVFDEERAYRDINYLKSCIESIFYIKDLINKKEIEKKEKDALRESRYMAVCRATPRWADKDKIKQIYAERRWLTELTGIMFHVDHIYPIKNPFVCGLHCEFNLQLLEAERNQSKSNNIEVYELP